MELSSLIFSYFSRSNFSCSENEKKTTLELSSSKIKKICYISGEILQVLQIKNF